MAINLKNNLTRTYLNSSAAALLAAAMMLPLTFTPVSAGQQGEGQAPAVDGLNSKISFEAGGYNDEEEFLANASITTPFGHGFGLQFDALIGERFDETIAGGGIHFFHRDPARYLIGIYASGHHLDPATLWRAAIEFELYFDRVSVEGIAGYESVDLPSTLGGLNLIDGDDDHAFTALNVGFYVTDDFRITGGYRYANEQSLGVVEAEYAMHSHRGSYSLFARGQFGDEEYEKISAGIRWYFGQEDGKSLKRRHREDDPTNWTPELPLQFNINSDSEVGDVIIIEKIDG